MSLSIVAVDPLGDAALALLRDAAVEARALYPELFEADVPLPTNEPAAPGSVYLVAYDGRVPAGCAALRPIDGLTAEVRRVYVARSHRRSGVARALMQQLDAAARALGYTALKLETGNRQQPAMALYAALGWQRIAAFGPYIGDATSVCFGKALA